MFHVLAVINFQNRECTTWWLTVHEITQNSNCNRHDDSFNNFKLLQLFVPARWLNLGAMATKIWIL